MRKGPSCASNFTPAKLCSTSNGAGVSQMSNRIKYNNLMMVQELAELDRASHRQDLPDDSHDFSEFERKKNEVNKELIKL